eukprot:3433488-Prymnesium_polylepis.1
MSAWQRVPAQQRVRCVWTDVDAVGEMRGPESPAQLPPAPRGRDPRARIEKQCSRATRRGQARGV